MRATTAFCFAAVATLALGACRLSDSRDFVRAVGSSTVFPFATAVAEQVGKAGGRTPVVESTGTGAGMKLFCAGLGAAHPDVEDASRRMKASEFADCKKNGVTEIVEIQVGLDGIAFAESKQGPGMQLTPVDVYKALAANPFGKPNATKAWSDVNPALPAIPILVYGPPTTSGTRDALAELILTKGCDTDAATKALAEAEHKQVCTSIRDDGAYVDSGENDNLIVQKIAQNPKAIGIFGYSYLEENPQKLRGIPIAGVLPRYREIADFSYPGARPLYIYVKKAHISSIPGLSDYVAEWTRAWGPDGYLRLKGLIVSPEDVRARNREIATKMVLMDSAALK